MSMAVTISALEEAWFFVPKVSFLSNKYFDYLRNSINFFWGKKSFFLLKKYFIFSPHSFRGKFKSAQKLKIDGNAENGQFQFWKETVLKLFPHSSVALCRSFSPFLWVNLQIIFLSQMDNKSSTNGNWIVGLMVTGWYLLSRGRGSNPSAGYWINIFSHYIGLKFAKFVWKRR